MSCKLAAGISTTHLVPHNSSAIEENSRIIRPLDVILLRTVEKTVSTVEDLPGLTVYQSDVRYPVVRFFGPLEVCLILSKRSETCGDVEEAAIRDRVLVMIAIIEREDLPPQSSAACLHIPPASLRVEYTLSKSQPLWLILRRIWEAILGSGHGSEGPEHLIVIAFRFCLIWRHEVAGFAGLVEDSLSGDFIVGRISGKSPVVDKGSKHSASLPPVVRVSEKTGDATRGVAIVVAHHIESYSARSTFNGVCRQRSAWLTPIEELYHLPSFSRSSLMPTVKGRQAKRPKAIACAHDGSTIIIALCCARSTKDYAR